MITVYTTNSCSSCRKAVSYFKENNIKFVEKNMFQHSISKDDVIRMLKNSENGFEDIISTRSKIIQQQKINLETMKFSDLVDFIIENPSVLRRPIIVNENIMLTGYDDDEITAFKPREFRRMFNCDTCGKDIYNCEYVEGAKKAFEKK